MENANPNKDAKKEYREMVNQLGKKEFTLIKMQEYGFWPENLPTPYEKQSAETEEDFLKRNSLLQEYNNIAEQIASLYETKNKIGCKLRELKKQYNQTWDYDKIRKDVAKQIMLESIARRAERKQQQELANQQVSVAWQKHKTENIVFIGKGYSNLLNHKTNDETKLISYSLPVISDDKELANFLGIEYKQLRFLTYHRDVMKADHYHHYTIAKRNGGTRNIAAPKPLLKKTQNKILELILEKIQISDAAHGFIKGKSILTGAQAHNTQPYLLVNMDIKDFFPTITFHRVLGLFQSFGYSGYISSLLAMLCTYTERMPIEIKGEIKYVKTSERILPQGSPASPMMTNIICRKMDENINYLAQKYNFSYSRYADDMSFSYYDDFDEKQLKHILSLIRNIVKQQGFQLNDSKTRFLHQNNRQSITGIVINNKQIGVPKKWVKNLRSAIHHANIQKQKGKLSDDIISKITGNVAWLKAVNEQRYQNIIIDANNLLNN